MKNRFKPIVLIHGFPFNHTMWAPQIPALSEKYRVVAHDVLGDGRCTIEFFVDDLIALLDQQKIEKAVLCGLSMGGYIALRALERHPERVSALVLADTQSGADSDEVKIKRSASLKLIQEKGLPLFMEGILKAVLSPETFSTRPQVVTAVKEMILTNSPQAVCSALLALASRTDTTASLKHIKIPTLILVGEQDQLTPPALSITLNKNIKNSEMHVIGHSGHLSNLENPAEFNYRLLSFLAEIM